jgi:hypothetical protein
MVAIKGEAVAVEAEAHTHSRYMAITSYPTNTSGQE